MNVIIDVDSPSALREHLNQSSLPRKATVSIRLPEHAYSTRFISVPAYFSSIDIEQHIQQEQATYFPHIAESVYFDFQIKEDRQVLVYAMAVSNAEHFLNILATFGIPAKRVIIQPIDIMINILPWREWQHQAHKQKRGWSIIAGISVGLLLTGTMSGILHRDIHRLSLEQARLQHAAAPFQKILDQQAQANQLKKAQAAQYHWLCLLKDIEVLRPPHLVLSNITRKDDTLVVDGQAKAIPLIKTYENALQNVCTVRQVNLLSIEKSTNKTFPWVFRMSLH